jgi:DNA-binding GntR family transcriptional regulator
MTQRSLRSLKSALDAHLRASRQVHLYDRLTKDMAFHLTLASLSGCGIQLETLKNLFDLLYLKYGGKFLFSTSMDSADTDHAALYAHIAGMDQRGAKRVLSRHIRRVKHHVLQGVERMLDATRL